VCYEIIHSVWKEHGLFAVQEELWELNGQMLAAASLFAQLLSSLAYPFSTHPKISGEDFHRFLEISL
jgi:hypothetical protein